MFNSLNTTFPIVVACVAGYMMPWLHVYGWTFKWMLIGMLFVTFLGIRFKRMKPERPHWLLVGANLLIALAAWSVCRASFGGGYLAEAAFFVGVMPTAPARAGGPAGPWGAAPGRGRVSAGPAAPPPPRRRW